MDIKFRCYSVSSETDTSTYELEVTATEIFEDDLFEIIYSLLNEQGYERKNELIDTMAFNLTTEGAVNLRKILALHDAVKGDNS